MTSMHEAVRRTALLPALLAAFILAALPARAEKFAPDATSFFLDNGLQVVVIPDHRTPVVTHMVWYKVGSADEPEGKTGVAHFLEHLLFKGTEKYPQGAFSRMVAERGGQENAFTSSDYTGYYQRVAKQHLPLVMELEADRMANLVLGEEETVAERNVVMEERRSRVGNDPGSQLSEELDAALYRSHPYGRPTIGWAHEIEQLNREDALDFYRTHYSPNNAVVVIAGDVSEEEVRREAARTYGVLAKRAEIGPRERTAEPPQRAPRKVSLVNQQVEQATLQRLYDVPSYNTTDVKEAAALDVLSELLGGGTTSRLYRRLVVTDKVAVRVGAWYSGTSFDGGQFGLYGVPAAGVELAEVEAAIDAELAAFVDSEITPEELERARTGLLASAIYAQDSQFALARVFGTALTTGATVEEVQNWPEHIAAVTAEEVKAVARKYIDARRSVTGYLLPPERREEAIGSGKRS